MNSRLARFLIGLYPASWRARYADEFEAFLEDQASGARSVVNVAGWAAYERLLSLGGCKVDGQQRSFVWMCFAFLASIAGGINFYWTVADTPLAGAMREHAALFTSWNLVRGGSLLSAAAIAVVGVPVLATILKSAIVTRRWSAVRWVAVPLVALLVILVWLAGATQLSESHWVPTPWDVTGDWTAPENWPSVTTRWGLSILTFVVIAAGIMVTAVSLRQAIRQSDFSKRSRFLFAGPSILLAAAVAIMTAGVVSWGWFVEKFAASDFHARNGGFFNSTNFASWMGSFIVFIVATVMAMQSARSALSLKTE